MTQDTRVAISNNAWQEILNGKPEVGIRIYAHLSNDQFTLSDCMNRGVGYLLLNDFDKALHDFQMARRHYSTFRPMNVFVGISLYLQGLHTEAVAGWLAEIEANRSGMITNAVGNGVNASLLLWWYGKKHEEEEWVEQAIQEIKRLLLLPPGDAWIHSLMNFIIGQESLIEVESVVKQTGNSYNTARRLAIVYFYEAASHLPDNAKYTQMLTVTIAKFAKNSILDPEYHLALHE